MIFTFSWLFHLKFDSTSRGHPNWHIHRTVLPRLIETNINLTFVELKCETFGIQEHSTQLPTSTSFLLGTCALCLWNAIRCCTIPFDIFNLPWRLSLLVLSYAVLRQLLHLAIFVRMRRVICACWSLSQTLLRGPLWTILSLPGRLSIIAVQTYRSLLLLSALQRYGEAEMGVIKTLRHPLRYQSLLAHIRKYFIRPIKRDMPGIESISWQGRHIDERKIYIG